MYQAIFDTSDVIRTRVKRLKDHGIGVEGTILLGTDEQDEDYIKRLIDFLLEIGIDMAEFTILTPFPHSPIRERLEREGRILSNNWLDYTADKVVFQPERMTPEKLREMFLYAWDTFYRAGATRSKWVSYSKKSSAGKWMTGPIGDTTPGENGPLKLRQKVMSKVFLVSSNTMIEPYPVYPLGMAVVASALTSAGHTVRQFDLLTEDRSVKRLIEALIAFNPDFVGISMRNIDTVDSFTSEESWTLDSEREIIHRIKENTKVPVILGDRPFRSCLRKY